MTWSAIFADFWAARALFGDAIAAATAAGCVLGLMGVYVVLRRMVFLSAALSQAAGLGVTLGFAAQAACGVAAETDSELWVAGGAIATTALATALVVYQGRHRATGQDSLLGAIFLVGSAGSLVVATRIVAELHDVQSVLLGSAVAVLPAQARGIILLSGALVALHLWLQRGLVEALFDADGARVRGLPVGLLHGALMVGLALAISVCTRVLGALPVFAFSVLPALAVLGWVRSMPQALVAAACVGAGSGAVGYFVAYVYALPVGAAQTLVAAACAAVGVAVGRLRRA